MLKVFLSSAVPRTQRGSIRLDRCRLKKNVSGVRGNNQSAKMPFLKLHELSK